MALAFTSGEANLQQRFVTPSATITGFVTGGGFTSGFGSGFKATGTGGFTSGFGSGFRITGGANLYASLYLGHGLSKTFSEIKSGIGSVLNGTISGPPPDVEVFFDQGALASNTPFSLFFAAEDVISTTTLGPIEIDTVQSLTNNIWWLVRSKDIPTVLNLIREDYKLIGLEFAEDAYLRPIISGDEFQLINSWENKTKEIPVSISISVAKVQTAFPFTELGGVFDEEKGFIDIFFTQSSNILDFMPTGTLRDEVILSEQTLRIFA